MKVSIGKNTLGGGKKMMTRLNNYNRSTHDLSFVCRTTMAPGVLVPTLKIKVLPGDTFPIQTRCHTLTHPTIGPLFGSFKQQNDFFFCPDRLYNALLHNNSLNIGLNMKNVKYPKIKINRRNWSSTDFMTGSGGTLLNLVNPSALPAYLGYRSLQDVQGNTPNEVEFNITPIIAYFDIFKNYYANKQEPNFYVIGGGSRLSYHAINLPLLPMEYKTAFATYDKQSNVYNIITQFYPTPEGTFNVPNPPDGAGSSYNYIFIIQGSQSSEPPIEIRDLSISMKLVWNTYYKGQINSTKTFLLDGTIDELLNAGLIKGINVVGVSSPTKAYALNGFQVYYASEGTSDATYESGIKIYRSKAKYNSYPLTDIDNLREDILAAGRQQFYVQSDFIQDIFENVKIAEGMYRPACFQPMVGLALKTYQSDINTNWVNTEWIEGDSGINAITAIDTSTGSFTLDTLNLAKKVYTMLNRIAVSDGSYNAWIQTVYTSGGLNHIETPVYLGGSSLEIEFQEVINNSGTKDQPLGTLAGRGVATAHKGGNIVFKADEPGYIFCITSLTPRTDYYQGNEWDIYLNSLDELHKPQLDGIGFQDRQYKLLNASAQNGDLELSIGKQPAWIEYMTNVNKTYGNFALIENEGWMCLNRIFGDIDTYTTYIQPHLYNNIFADVDITAQNFWVQIAFNMKPRRVMSAKIIPNI